MIDMEQEAIKQAVHAALSERESIDRDTHKSHHDFVQDEIERTRRRRENFDKIRAQVGGWLVISILSGFAYAMWQGAKAVFNKGVIDG